MRARAWSTKNTVSPDSTSFHFKERELVDMRRWPKAGAARTS
jgi:hypothetical protein